MALIVESAELSKALFSHGDLLTLTLTVRAEDGDVTGLRGDLYVDARLDTDGETADVRFKLCGAFSSTDTIFANGESRSLRHSFYVRSNTVDPFQTAILEQRALETSLQLSYTDGDGSEGTIVPELRGTLLNRWMRPSIDLFTAARCSNGEPVDDGTAVRASLRICASGGTDGLSLILDWGESLDLSQWIGDALTGITDSDALIPVEFAAEQDWSLRLRFGDDYEVAEAVVDLARAFANLHLSGRAMGGACFGGFSTATDDAPKLESHFPAYFYGGIEGVSSYAAAELETGGTWIDGKKIYRRVISASVAASKANAIAIDVDFDAVIRLEGMLRYTNASGATQHGMDFFVSGSVYAYLYAQAGTIYAYSTQAGEVWVIVEYTKAA